MKTYEITQESAISNRIVKELNACVLSLTFKSEGVQMAELWSCAPNSSDVVIGLGHCPPIHGKFVSFIQINFFKA